MTMVHGPVATVPRLRNVQAAMSKKRNRRTLCPKMKTHSGAKKRIKSHRAPASTCVVSRPWPSQVSPKASRPTAEIKGESRWRPATPKSSRSNSAAETSGGIEMARVKRAVHAKKSHKKVLESGQGLQGSQESALSRLPTSRSCMRCRTAYRDRSARKGEFRRLWIARINAAARQNGTTYTASS